MQKFNEKSNTWYYLEEWKDEIDYDCAQLLHKEHYKGENGGRGDALWRLGLALIAYPEDKRFLNGINALYVDKGKYIQPIRHKNHNGNNTSRDQVIMSLVALIVTGRVSLAKHFASKLRFNLSSSGKLTSLQTVDMWVWLKAIQGKKWAKWMFPKITFYMPLMQKRRRKALIKSGVKFVEQNEYVPYSGEFTEKQKKILSRQIPPYAIHLYCWQLYSLGIKNKYLAQFIEQSNYLLRLLLGDGRVWFNLINYSPMSEFRFQRELTHPNRNICRVITDTENTLDKKVFENILKKEYKNL